MVGGGSAMGKRVHEPVAVSDPVRERGVLRRVAEGERQLALLIDGKGDADGEPEQAEYCELRREPPPASEHRVKIAAPAGPVGAGPGIGRGPISGPRSLAGSVEVTSRVLERDQLIADLVADLLGGVG